MAFISCTKETVEICKKRYVTSVTIFALPSGFDIVGEPDLRCDIAPLNSSYWSFPSYSVDNVSGLPITISFEENVLLSKETWSMRLVDIDLIGEDLIYQDNFDPYIDKDGTIGFKRDGVIVLTLNYTESE